VATIGLVQLIHLSGDLYEFSGTATFIKSAGCLYFMEFGSEDFIGTWNGNPEPVNIGLTTEFDCGRHFESHSCHGTSEDDYWKFTFDAAMNGQQISLRWSGGLVTVGQECMPNSYAFCTGSEDESLWTVLSAGGITVA